MRSRPEIVVGQEKPETLRLLSSVLEYYWKINGGDKLRCIFLVFAAGALSAPSNSGGQSINHAAFTRGKCQVSKHALCTQTGTANIP